MWIFFLLQKGDYVVDTSLVGVVLNGLSHLYDVQTKEHFAVALIRGLGGNFSEATRENFAREVSQEHIVIDNTYWDY